MNITIDFETSSEADLREVGAWMYSRHPSTEAMCLGWDAGLHGAGQWRRGDPPPQDLFAAMQASLEVEAHNAFFEYAIWLNVCHVKYHWPAMPDDLWRCTAARAAACGLPRDLARAGRALDLDVVKDEGEGKREMMKLSRGKSGDVEKMLAYNRDDVAAEVALSEACADLSADELGAWQMSERVNRRGFAVDMAGCRAAIRVADDEAARLTARFQEITGLESAGQRARFIVWLNSRGICVRDTQAATLDNLIATLPVATDDDAVEAMRIMRAIGRSSVAKYRKLLDYADSDGRARGTLLFHGAHTGRWAGSGPQPHNFKREGPAGGMDRAWDAIATGDADVVRMTCGDPLEFLSRSVRGAIWTPPGRVLFAGDYAQIEPRVLFWWAGEREGLAAFARGEDMYLREASMIYNRRLERTKENEERRFLGKHAVLALGFGAGFVKYLLHCRELGAPRFTDRQIADLVPPGRRRELLAWILDRGWEAVVRQMPGATRADAEELVLARHVVESYRKRYASTVVRLWRDVEAAVRAAIGSPGRRVQVGVVSYEARDRWLECRLPSGRVMRYLDPAIDDDDGEITHAAMSDKNQFVRSKTYGGKLVENGVQAMARDVMVDGMRRLEATPPWHEIVLTVHDEVILEADEGAGSLNEFLGAMRHAPAWAPGLPVAVDGWIGRRYHK